MLNVSNHLFIKDRQQSKISDPCCQGETKSGLNKYTHFTTQHLLQYIFEVFVKESQNCHHLITLCYDCSYCFG